MTSEAGAAPFPAATGDRSGGSAVKPRPGDVPAEQVSFVIQHKVKPGHHAEYETWLHHIIGEAAKFHGHMGAHIARPPGDGDTYEISVRFASREDALAWMNSATRADLVRDVLPLIQEPERLVIRSGIDYWFTPATENHVAPPRWKQWLTTVSVIWPLSMLMPLALGYVFRVVPILGRFGVAQLVTAMCMVGLLVYVIMPPYTRAISKWLSK